MNIKTKLVWHVLLSVMVIITAQGFSAAAPQPPEPKTVADFFLLVPERYVGYDLTFREGLVRRGNFERHLEGFQTVREGLCPDQTVVYRDRAVFYRNRKVFCHNRQHFYRNSIIGSRKRKLAEYNLL